MSNSVIKLQTQFPSEDIAKKYKPRQVNEAKTIDPIKQREEFSTRILSLQKSLRNLISMKLKNINGRSEEFEKLLQDLISKQAKLEGEKISNKVEQKDVNKETTSNTKFEEEKTSNTKLEEEKISNIKLEEEKISNTVDTVEEKSVNYENPKATEKDVNNENPKVTEKDVNNETKENENPMDVVSEITKKLEELSIEMKQSKTIQEEPKELPHRFEEEKIVSQSESDMDSVKYEEDSIIWDYEEFENEWIQFLQEREAHRLKQRRKAKRVKERLARKSLDDIKFYPHSPPNIKSDPFIQKSKKFLESIKKDLNLRKNNFISDKFLQESEEFLKEIKKIELLSRDPSTLSMRVDSSESLKKLNESFTHKSEDFDDLFKKRDSREFGVQTPTFTGEDDISFYSDIQPETSVYERGTNTDFSEIYEKKSPIREKPKKETLKFETPSQTESTQKQMKKSDRTKSNRESSDSINPTELRQIIQNVHSNPQFYKKTRKKFDLSKDSRSRTFALSGLLDDKPSTKRLQNLKQMAQQFNQKIKQVSRKRKSNNEDISKEQIENKNEQSPKKQKEQSPKKSKKEKNEDFDDPNTEIQRKTRLNKPKKFILRQNIALSSECVELMDEPEKREEEEDNDDIPMKEEPIEQVKTPPPIVVTPHQVYQNWKKSKLEAKLFTTTSKGMLRHSYSTTPKVRTIDIGSLSRSFPKVKKKIEFITPNVRESIFPSTFSTLQKRSSLLSSKSSIFSDSDEDEEFSTTNTLINRIKLLKSFISKDGL